MGNSFPASLEETVKVHLRRLNSRLRGSGRALDLTVETDEDARSTYLRFRLAGETLSGGEAGTLVIPRARKNQFGNWVVGDRHDRALCPFMIVLDGRPQHMSYEKLIMALLSCNMEDLFPEQGKRNQIDKMLWGFASGRGRLSVSLCQRFLNLNLFNALPLSEAPMQDWAMNNRLMIFDPIFDTLRPEEKLEYQKRKNQLLFPWGSIGLSDSAAAVRNYILQVDLREFTAFGEAHHNPMRNLYSTLGMKGEEPALVTSESARKLEDRGVVRKGWNWLTAFLDLPDNFEDQILVDRRHAGKKISYRRTFTLFGPETVEVGDNILKGRVLGVNEGGEPTVFDVDCDHATVTEIKDSAVPFDGLDQPVRVVCLEVVFSFKEGFKITNQHGNKGIVRLMDLGCANIGGEVRPLDVIVSAKSVQRRKNFGQVLEALTNLLHQGERVVVANDYEASLEQIQGALRDHGYPEDGAFQVETPWGEFRTLVGPVHWGVTKTPEEQLWQGRDTWTENQRGLRTRGSKVSIIELKALTTLFGPGSKVVREILSHQQGADDVREQLSILESLRGNYREVLPTVEAESFVYLPAGLGTFHSQEELTGTLADEQMYPNGCYLQLPVTLRIEVPDARWKKGIFEGLATDNAYEDPEQRVFETDRILIPHFALRQPWKHPTGKFGLSDTTTLLNQILEGSDRLKCGEIKAEQLAALVYRYFHYVSRSLSTKSGAISTYLMSVRYPWSSKATAALGHNLAPNWIEIHRDMAYDLRVEDGDYVLVERFPCLGFMSTRIQRVQVTDDPECKYVIRVSGNSLVSMNLDFDGDVIYVMSFRSAGAKHELMANFHLPHPKIKEVIDRMNARKVPVTRSMTLPELGLRSFAPLGPDEHAELNATSLSVKLFTGPVIALCYNLMRIVEGSFSYHDRKAHIHIEVFLDKLGNSVFSQKHGTKSLREECVEAVCLADSERMVKLGFPAEESSQLCRVIREFAGRCGVRTDAELREHYRRHVEEGRSSIINAIVRRFHQSYFATRANLHPIDLLKHLEAPPNDLVGYLLQESLATRDAMRQAEASM